ncbi:pollen-specific leucine-rich repeat extensin-like protein 4, partial [Olea europaea var. sylvestris]|uniref:pollen-specific leucine-rich repeat extensin-like protein 4 n=1 Tax=Olea europaea var. sylvestris TaxID=158386 RepID=UPI000C1D6614
MANPSKMNAFGCFLVVFLSLFSSFSSALTDAEAAYIARRQLLHHPDDDSLPNESEYEIDARLTFANPRLKKAYIALQAFKKAIYSDPQNFTANWEGANVCAYNGVFCAQALDNPKQSVVAGVDLNHADIAGHLPIEIGHLVDISLLHLNSNRFCGIIPKSIAKLTLLFELDVSNNRFVGPFPEVVLELPSLKYLDLRYNDFEGQLPPQLFNKPLDALFLNDNRFHSTIPENFGNSTVSVLVLSNNKFHGCIPKSIGKMANTLDEILLSNNALSGCLPEEITLLKSATVFDISDN